jgi:hypothetical protein
MLECCSISNSLIETYAKSDDIRSAHHFFITFRLGIPSIGIRLSLVF